MKKVILHPFLLAVFPVISLWGANVGYITGIMVIRSLILSIVLASVLFLFAHLVTREWLKAGIIASILILLVFLYGHLYSALRDIQFLNSIIRHRYLLPFILLFCAFLIILIWKKNELASPVSLFLNVAGLTLVVIPLISLLMYQITAVSSGNDFVPTQISTGISSQESKPDIYYIILDAYGRKDILQELYNYDNSEFIHGLEKRGFYVADKSDSNYMQTYLSLSSSLNMNYLNQAISQNNGKFSIPLLMDLISRNQLSGILREQGYKTITFKNGFEDLSWADIFLQPPNKEKTLSQVVWNINEFEGLLINSTIGRIWLDSPIVQNNKTALLEEPYIKHRNQVLFALTEFDHVAKIPGNKFVFVHVVAPHPPFVFDNNGGMIHHSSPYTMNDADEFPGGLEEYKAGYTKQIQYVNVLTLYAVDQILANSPEPPVIIIQGDHGPRAYLKWGSIESSNTRESMGILNAYYFPDQNYAMLYPSISPVNSFRVVLNKYFGTNMDLLPDDHFFSSNFDYFMDGSWTADLINVDNKLNIK
jgi:hypothetical protein